MIKRNIILFVFTASIFSVAFAQNVQQEMVAEQTNVCTCPPIQAVIIGYIDKDAVIKSLPQVQDINDKILQMRVAYEKEYNKMNEDYKSKVKDYLKENKVLSEPIKLARQAEITEIENRMVVFKDRYLHELSIQKESAMRPLIAEFDKVVSEVATENNVTIVLNSSTPVWVSANCINIQPLVRQKLGI